MTVNTELAETAKGSPLVTQPSTAPRDINFNMRGFENPEEAEVLAHATNAAIQSIGEHMDLSGLSGVTIGLDYDEALSSVDRGIPGLRPLSRTISDEIAGVAMAPAVIRCGSVKTHLVFWAPVLSGLRSDAPEAMRQSLAVIAHECGHVAEHNDRDRVLPRTILQHQFTSWEEAFLFPPAEAIWGEYAACRHSAVLAGTSSEAAYREGLASVLKRARIAANDAIRSYRLHGDLNRVLSEAGNAIAEPLRLAAYLGGHLDGLGRDAIQEIQGDLAADQRLGRRIAETLQAARIMWDERESWADLSVYEPLKDIVRSSLADYGIFLRPKLDGSTRVEIPLSPETMPL